MNMYEGSPAVIIERRKGTIDSPFSNMNETLTVGLDGKAILSEIPNELNKVVVTSSDNTTWYEVREDVLETNAYKVDYINKVVTFNIAHVGKQLHFQYTGEGNHYYSPNTIYTKLEEGRVVETLEDVVVAGKEATMVLGRVEEAVELATLATEEAILATDESIIATNNANTATSESIIATNKAITATTNANLATTNANSAATNANNAKDATIQATTNAVNATNTVNARIDVVNDKIDEVNVILPTINTAIANANTATANANNAKDNALLATTNAINATTDVVSATQDANLATAGALSAKTQTETATTNAINATSDAILATTNANNATSDAIVATTNAQLVADNTKSVGNFVFGQAYKKNNLVLNNGSTFIALQDTKNNPLPILPVTENANWRLVAQRGIDGEGSVRSVNGIFPNVDGNVTLDLGDTIKMVDGFTPDLGGNVTTHTNKSVLDALTDDAGQLKYNNQVVGSVTSVNGQTGDVVIPNASLTENGLMTTAQVTKLSGIQNGANYVNVVDNTTSTSPTSALSANQGKIVSDQITVLTEDVGEKSSLNTTNKTNVVNAVNEINNNLTTLDNKVTTHSSVIASETELGHVKVDGTSIVIDANGVISAVKLAPPPKIYGVKIDTTNSNPETALTYTDDAIGFTPAKGNNGNFSYGSWEDKFPFIQIKPCVLKNGVVQYYLNPNDYTKKVNGSNADITSGNDGDVMVEFPKVWWKFETIGNDLYVKYSNKKIDSSWKCHAHTRGTTEKDFVYISAYMGNTISSKLRSLSGKLPTATQTIGTFRTQAQANGTGYEQMAYYQLLMLQVLFIVMFKNRDSQTALGRGYVDGNASAITTGGTNTKGLFFGETTGKLQNKFCGIEDFWGNTYYWIDGIFSGASRNILIGNQNFNDNGSGYVNYGQGTTSNIGGYIGKVQGGSETGFIIKSSDGSATTHYCDYGDLNASCLPTFSGRWNNASDTGAFRLDVSYSAVSSNAFISGRSLFL